MTSKRKKKKKKEETINTSKPFSSASGLDKKTPPPPHTKPYTERYYGKDTTFRTGFNKEIFLFDIADKEEDVRPQTSHTISNLVNICKCFRERNYTLRHFFFNYRLQMRFVRVGKCIP